MPTGAAPLPQGGGPVSDGASCEPSGEAAPSPVPIDVDILVPVPVPGSPSLPEESPVALPDAGGLEPGFADAGSDPAAPSDAAAPASQPSTDLPADAGAFTIELVFDDDSEPSPAVREAFSNAKARWEAVIVGELPDVTLNDKTSCDGHDLPETIDDILVFVTVSDIDGAEGVLGAAGPCAIRSRTPRLPFAAAMNFDAIDLELFAENGRLEEIVLHEMGHALGLGSLWEAFGLIDEPSDGSGASDTSFNGSAARREFDAVVGDDYEGNRVPVENAGTEGEINGHWREMAMGSELMTTRMGSSVAQLSAITIAALGDMGYEVDLSRADPYEWPSVDPDFAFRVVGAPLPELDLSHDLLRLPLLELTDQGTWVRLR